MTRTIDTQPGAPPLVRGRGAVLLAGLVVALAGVLATVLGAREEVIVGLRDAGPVVDYSLRAARGLSDVTAVVTIGALLALALLIPARVLNESPQAAMRLGMIASRWAIGWTVAAFALLVLSCADAAGLGVVETLRAGYLDDYVIQVDRGRALVSMIVLAALVAVAARWVPTRATSWLLLGMSVAALVPGLLTGHAGHGRANTLVSTYSLVVHVPAAAMWVGGLLVLVVHLRRWPQALHAAVPRFSILAGAAFVVVAGSGVAAGWSRVPALEQLWSTPYGRLLLAKVTLLVVLGVFGWLHRRRTVRAAADGRDWPLLRLAAVELLVMGVTVGVAAALANTPPPPL